MNGLRLSVHKTLLTAILTVAAAFCNLHSNPAAAEGYVLQQNLDWYYTIRPGDSLPEIANRLLKSEYSWTSLAHHNHVKDVNKIQIGSILKVPITWLKHSPQPAIVKTFEGEALVKRRQDTRYETITEQIQLYVGDEILTRQGSMDIVFADNTTLRLDQFSNLIFNKLSSYQNTGMVDARMRLSRGGLRTKVSPLTKGSRYEISTPSAVAAVRGTDFRLRSSSEGTVLEVIEGAVEFIYDHGTKFIEATQGAKIFAKTATLEQIDLSTLPRLPEGQVPQSASGAALNWSGLPANYTVSEIIASSVAVAQASQNAYLEPGQTVGTALTSSTISTSDPDGLPPSNTISSGPKNNTPTAILNQPLAGSIASRRNTVFTWSVDDPNTLSRFELSKTKDFNEIVAQSSWSTEGSFRVQDTLIPGKYVWRVRTLAEGSPERVTPARSVSIQGSLDIVNILSVSYIGNHVGIFWHPIDNAQGYVLQVSDDKEFRRLLKEQSLSKTEAFLKLPEDTPFYARVKGLGDEIYASEFGPSKDIIIEPKQN